MPSKTPDVAPMTPIATTWGNEIRNRTSQVFANVEEREAWLTPPDGAFCVTLDTYTLWFRRTGAWEQQNARGLLEEYRSTGTISISAGADHELWAGGALDVPVNPNHTALISVGFGAYEPTIDNPTVLWVSGLLGADETKRKSLGSLAVRDTNAAFAIAVTLNTVGVWSTLPTDPPQTAISVLVTNVGGNAAAIDSVVITVTEV